MIHFFFHIYVNFTNLRTDVLHDSYKQRKKANFDSSAGLSFNFNE